MCAGGQRTECREEAPLVGGAPSLPKQLVVIVIVERRALGDPDVVEAADLLAGAVGVYLWRQGTKGGSLAFVGLVSGLIVLGMAAAATLRDARAVHWASTPGTVGWGAPSCHAAIAPHTPYRGPEPPTTLCFSPIYYRYRVGDRDYAGTRVTFNDLLLADLDWNWEAKYEDNRNVTVRYDPADPAIAVLEPRTPGRTLLWVVGVWFTLGLGYAFVTNRQGTGDSS